MPLFDKKKNASGMELDKLLAAIGRAVADAGHACELASLENYIKAGFSETAPGNQGGTAGTIDGGQTEKGLVPVCLNMDVGGRALEVPVTALLHNTGMGLEEAEITVRVKLTEEGGKVYAAFTDGGVSKDGLNEIRLKFTNRKPAEGVSRIGDLHIEKI